MDEDDPWSRLGAEGRAGGHTPLYTVGTMDL